MEVKCLYDELVPLRKLKPHPKNRNKHPDEQIGRLAKILQYQGVRYPIKVSKRSGFITSGHGRLEAAKLIGWATFPVNYQDYDSDEQEYADLQADNAIASWAELDLSSINTDLGDLGPDFDIDMLGLKDFEVEVADKEGQGDPDETPDPPVVAKSKFGELYLMGQHRLLCGDSTKRDDVERLMAGEKSDMVYTDPPYGISLDGSYSSMPSRWNDKEQKHKFKDIEGDNFDYDPSPIFRIPAKEVFVWGANNFITRVPEGEKGSWIVWDKKVNENLDRMISGDFELCWSKNRHKYSIARFKFSGIFGTESEDTKSRVHPSQKPVLLHEWFFERWGKQAKIIVDLYLGSGSTLIACEKTHRKCYGMELDPQYIDVILDRWEKYTGKQAIREDGVLWQDIKHGQTKS